MFRDDYRREMNRIRIDEGFLRDLEGRAAAQRRDAKPARKLALVLAVLFVLLLATAAAAAVRGNLLRRKLEEAGAEDFAAQVQDIHVADAAQGFSFSIDEAAWEGGDLLVSVSAAVPGDGNTYLLALDSPEMNGAKLDYSEAYYVDNSAGILFPLGGDYAETYSGVLRLRARDAGREENRLEMRAAFLKPARPVKAVEDYWNLMEEGDRYGRVLPDSDFIYCSGDPATVCLRDFREVQDLMEERGVPFAGVWYAGEPVDENLSVQDAVDAGLCSIAAQRQVSIPLEAPLDADQGVYNAVAQAYFELDGCTLEIREFSMSHLGLEMEFTLRFADREDRDAAAARGRSFTLLRPDGSSLWPNPSEDGVFPGVIWGSTSDGDGCYTVTYNLDSDEIIPLEGLGDLLLTPAEYVFDADDMFIVDTIYHLDEAVAITPVVREETAGDANLVWATAKGTWYHAEEHCIGMRNARRWTRVEAEAAGKPPCPQCIGE